MMAATVQRRLRLE